LRRNQTELKTAYNLTADLCKTRGPNTQEEQTMDKKFTLSVLLIFVLSMILGFITHAWALADEYTGTGLYREATAQEALFPWMLLAHIILAIAFVALYRKGLEDKPWVGQGVRFGILIALIAYVPIYLIYYVVQPMPEMLVFRQAAYETVNTVVLGLAVAWMYR
jgi:magnesium-transporting ATPase (P-type)